MGGLIHVHTEEEFQANINGAGSFGGKAVVVDFFAEWCGPCKAISPLFEQLTSQYPNVTFLKVDVDELQEVAQSCGVRAMPTFQGYFNGAKVEEVVGADPSKLKAMIASVANRATGMGQGRKLGSDAPSSSTSATASGPAPAVDEATARRERMAAAAEARSKAMGQ